MPKLKHQPPSYSLHKASGQAVVKIDGRVKYLGKHNSAPSVGRYRRLVSEWLAGQGPNRAPLLPDPAIRDDLRICELVDAYLTFAETYYVKGGRATGELANMTAAVSPLVRLFADEPTAEFGPMKLKRVREEMVGNDVSRGVVNARTNRIRRVFKWGVENELVDTEILHALQSVAPLKKGRSPARETHRVQPVPDTDIQAVLKVVTTQIRAMIEVQRFTGMRPGELVLMRPQDIDRRRPIWVFVPSTHKTEHHDLVPFPRRVTHQPSAMREGWGRTMLR